MRLRVIPAALFTILAVTTGACQFGGIRGSGDIVEQTPDVAPFEQLDVSHAFDVEVAVGDEPSVTVAADDNVMEHVIATVSGDVLRLGLRPGFQVRDVTLQATVTTPQLEEIRASGATRVHVDGMVDGERLRTQASGASEVAAQVDVAGVEVVASGASTIRLEGAARAAQLEASGSSDLALSDLRTAEAQAQLSGASRLEGG